MPLDQVYFNNNNQNINLISGVMSQPIESYGAFRSTSANDYRFPVLHERRQYNSYISHTQHASHNMDVNYINIENIDITGGAINRIKGPKTTDQTITDTGLDLPFIFPLFLGDLTTHGINHGDRRNTANNYSINFYEDAAFQKHNKDAYDVFYAFNSYNSDIAKENCGMINTNMQYCYMQYYTLADYFKASIEWQQEDKTITNANIKEHDVYNKHLSQRGSNTANEFPIYAFDAKVGTSVVTFSTLNTLWTTMSRNASVQIVSAVTSLLNSTFDKLYTKPKVTEDVDPTWYFGNKKKSKKGGLFSFIKEVSKPVQDSYVHKPVFKNIPTRISVPSNIADSNKLDVAPDVILFRYFSNRFNNNMTLEVQRGDANRDGNDMFGGTRVNFNSIDTHSSIESGEEYVYVSYIANVTVQLHNHIVCGVGSYPKLLEKSYGLAIDYITKQQAFLYHAIVAETYGVYKIKGFGLTELNNLYPIEYNVPMVAKFKCEYSYSSTDNRRYIGFRLEDCAALNQFVTNTTKDYGNYYGFGTLENKQFVKAPFRLGEEAYQHRDGHKGGNSTLELRYGNIQKTISSSIPMPYLQYTTSSSILDVSNGKFVVAWYISKPQHWNTISPISYSVTSGYEKQVRGGVVAINMYDITSDFEKLTPDSTIIIDNVRDLKSLEFEMHNGKYMLATLDQQHGQIREMTHNGSNWTSNVIFDKTGIDSLNIAGLKDGELE